MDNRNNSGLYYPESTDEASDVVNPIDVDWDQWLIEGVDIDNSDTTISVSPEEMSDELAGQAGMPIANTQIDLLDVLADEEGDLQSPESEGSQNNGNEESDTNGGADPMEEIRRIARG